MQHNKIGTGRPCAAALCLLALLATALEAQSPDIPTNPFQADSAAALAGQRVFNSACVACHGLIAASPFSYAVNGEQYVAIAAGNIIYSFALPRRGPPQRLAKETRP